MVGKTKSAVLYALSEHAELIADETGQLGFEYSHFQSDDTYIRGRASKELADWQTNDAHGQASVELVRVGRRLKETHLALQCDRPLLHMVPSTLTLCDTALGKAKLLILVVAHLRVVLTCSGLEQVSDAKKHEKVDAHGLPTSLRDEVLALATKQCRKKKTTR